VEYCLNNPDDINVTPPGTYPCGFAYLMANCVDEDGLWNERMNYHWFTLQGLINISEPAYRAGVNLYRHPRFHAMLTGPLQLTLPNGMADETFRQRTWWYEIGQLRAPDPLFEAALAGIDLRRVAVDDRTLWITPPWATTDDRPPLALETKDFPGWGYTVLRSGQEQEQAFLSMCWGDHAIYMGHSQSLKFGPIYYAGGRLWTPFGPGGPYDNPMCGAWFRRAISHNALTVDGEVQKVSFGREVAFQAGPRLQLVKAVEDQAYPGVTQERLLVLADGYAVDLCTVASDREHRYDLAHHYFGDMTFGVAFQARQGPLGWRSGYEYVDALRSARTSGPWAADWRQDADHALRLTMLGGSPTELIAGEAPGMFSWGEPSERPEESVLGPVYSREKVPIIMVGRWGKRTTFVSLLEAYRDRPAITSVEPLTASRDGATAVRIRRGGATDYVVANPDPGRRTYPGLRFDGEFGMMSIATDSAEAHYAQLVNGRQLEGGGWSISSNSPATFYVERKGDDQYVLSTGAATTGHVRLSGRSAVHARVSVAHDALGTPDSVSFSVEAGQTYQISGLSGLMQVALQAGPPPVAAAPRPPAAEVAALVSPAPILGKNRVRNSGFEISGPPEVDPWQFGSSYYWTDFKTEHTYDNAVAHTGKYSLRLPALPWHSGVTCDAWISQSDVVAQPGPSTWTLSAYLRADKPTKVRLCLRGDEVEWGENNEGGVSGVYEIDAEWQRISITRQFRPGISSVGIVVKREHQMQGGQVWIDDVQLESGLAASAYTPDAWAR
jgi:hypothetical protein